MNTAQLVQVSLNIAEIVKVVALGSMPKVYNKDFNIVDLGGDGDCFWRSFIYLMNHLGINTMNIFELDVSKLENIWMSSELLMNTFTNFDYLFKIIQDDFTNTKRSEVNQATLVYLSELYDLEIKIYSKDRSNEIEVIGWGRINSVAIYHNIKDGHFVAMVSSH